MTEVRETTNDSLRRERLFVVFLLLVSSLTLAHAVHNGWYTYIQSSATAQSANGQPVFSLFGSVPSSAYAPEAYRIAIPMLGRFLLRSTGIKDPSVVAAALDLVFSFAALYLLYRVTMDGVTKGRMLTAAIFVAFVQLPLAWVVLWQRPETMPSAFYLAVALFCLVRSRARGVYLILWSVVGMLDEVRIFVPFLLALCVVAARTATTLTQEEDTAEHTGTLELTRP